MSGGRRVGVLFGGRSVEHEVSVDSARDVTRAMDLTDLVAVPIGVTGEGRWLPPDVSRAVLEGDAARVDARAYGDDSGRVVVDPGGQRLLSLVPGASPQPLELDVVFPLIHGRDGEDGRVQGALDLCGIPYVGAGVLGSAAGMDKAVSRRIFESHGLPGVRWLEVYREEHLRDPPALGRRVASELGYPVFVKPSNGGSSVGINRVAREADLQRAMDEAFDCDRKAVVETAVSAREIECAVLGNDEPRASTVGEIVPSGEFYDYAAKYVDGTSKLIIPAELDAGVVETLRRYAVAAFRAIEVSGFARVDFLVEKSSATIYLNEVNTLPGFTPISMFPKLWEASGLPYPRLIERLVDLALERWITERRLRTSLRAD